MALSILRNPPSGSELAARVRVLENAEFESDHRLVDEPSVKDAAELYEVIREPRSWKIPANLVARHILPYEFKYRYGEQAAADLEKCPDLALAAAKQFQQLDYLRSSAVERAKEPPSDLHVTAMPIIYAEYLAVKRRETEASDNRHYEVTGRNLGGRHDPIDRNAIRRAVQRFQVAILRLRGRNFDAAVVALAFLTHRDWPAVHSEHRFQCGNEQGHA